MSIALIVSKTHHTELNETGEEICMEAWLRYVIKHNHLRFRKQPFVCQNPITNEVIEIEAPPEPQKFL